MVATTMYLEGLAKHMVDGTMSFRHPCQGVVVMGIAPGALGCWASLARRWSAWGVGPGPNPNGRHGKGGWTNSQHHHHPIRLWRHLHHMVQILKTNMFGIIMVVLGLKDAMHNK